MIDVDRPVTCCNDDRRFFFWLAPEGLVEAEHARGDDCPGGTVAAPCRAHRIEHAERFDLGIVVGAGHEPTLPLTMPRPSVVARLRSRLCPKGK